VLAALDRGTIALIPARGGDLVDTGGVGHDVVMKLGQRRVRGRRTGWLAESTRVRQWDRLIQTTNRQGIDMNLADYKALSFDCYGTLIDWEAGIAAVVRPWATEVGLEMDDEQLLHAYAENEAATERETPAALYPDVLATAFRRTGNSLGKPVDDAWANRLGISVPDWPAFPDSAGALASLAKHFQLIILSNVHRDGFAGSNKRLCGTFAAVITAEDVGAYKPADNHFRALDSALKDLGIARDDLLHVAQSLFHDHVPAKRNGLASVWINRRYDRPGWGATPEPSEEWSFDLEFPSMADFARAVEQAFDAR
jgi:2-haloacid dehalogenase